MDHESIKLFLKAKPSPAPSRRRTASPAGLRSSGDTYVYLYQYADYSDPVPCQGAAYVGYGAAYDATINLWGSRLATSLAKSYTQTFVATFAKMAVYTPISYGLSSFGSWGVGQLGWGW